MEFDHAYSHIMSPLPLIGKHHAVELAHGADRANHSSDRVTRDRL